MLRWVGSVCAVVILVVLVAIWRLMQGPIELDWLTPDVETAFARSDIGLKVALTGVRLAINRTTHGLELRAENVRVALPDGKPLASFPEMTTSFDLRALLSGGLAAAQVTVERPVLHLVRTVSGAVAMRVGSAEIGKQGTAPADLGPPVLEELAGPPGRDTPLGLLHRINIRGATLIVDDAQSARTWQAKQVDIAIDRSSKGARGDVSFAVPIGTTKPELHASYRYLAERQLLDLDLSIGGVEPAAVPALIPELAQLRHVAAPVSGSLQTRIDLKAGRAQGSRLDLRIGKGVLHSDWLPAGRLAIAGGELQATYAPERNEVRVARMTLDLDGTTRLALEGTLSNVSPELIAAPAEARPVGHVGADLSARLTQLPVARLGELWPTALSPGGRRWALANIRDGTLDEASAQLSLDLDPVAHTAYVLSDTGQFRYHDLTVSYFNGLPPVRKVAGTAVFARNQLEFTPTAGQLKGVKVTGGSLRLTDLGAPVEWLTIDLALSGPLQDALDVLDAKPLHYARAIGVEPAHIGGRTDTELHFKLPLLEDLKLDQVDYAAKATIAGATAAKIALDRDLDDGNFTLNVRKTGAQLRGTARFDGVPTTLDAKVVFQPAGASRVTYRVGMTLDGAAQRRLGVNVAADRMSGPVAVDATYVASARSHGEATALLDLHKAALAIPEAGWRKPAGQPATAKIVVDLNNERITDIPQIAVSAPGLEGRLAARLGSDYRSLDRVEIRRLAVADNLVSGIVSRRSDGGWRADIHAARIDAQPLLKDAMSGPADGSSTPLAVDARVDRLVLGPQRELQHVDAELLRTGGSWASGRIDGRFADGHRLSLRFGESGGQRLTLKSDDLGASLKFFDVADNVVGGSLTLDGRLSDGGGKRMLRAHVEGENYTVTRASVLAHLLALPSLTGLASTLSGSGLWFSSLDADVALSGGRVTVDRLLAFGESLGVTARGWVDTDADRLELQGTVAPAYALNAIVGHVPIIGPLLGGGSQGLIAANYRLSGSTADPQAAVNPLSALAPGILRQIFAPLVGFPSSPPQPQ